MASSEDAPRRVPLKSDKRTISIEQLNKSSREESNDVKF